MPTTDDLGRFGWEEDQVEWEKGARAFAEQPEWLDPNLDRGIQAFLDGIEIGIGDGTGIVVPHDAQRRYEEAIRYQRYVGGLLITNILHEEREQLNTAIMLSVASNFSRDQTAQELLKMGQHIQTERERQSSPRWSKPLMPEWRARLIAQTEVIGSFNGAHRSAMEFAGVERVVWLDGQAGACAECRALNGSEVETQGGSWEAPRRTWAAPGRTLSSTVKHPPAHPGCRCAIGPAEEEAKPKPEGSLKGPRDWKLPKDLTEGPDLNDYLNGRFPNVGEWPGISRQDKSGGLMDLKLKREVLERLDKLEREYPQIFARIHTIGFKPTSDFSLDDIFNPNWFAETIPDGQTLWFNRNFWEDYDTMEELLKTERRGFPKRVSEWGQAEIQDPKTHRWVEDTPENRKKMTPYHPRGSMPNAAAIVDHEWGHFLDIWYQHGIVGTSAPGFDYAKSASDVKMASGDAFIKNIFIAVHNSPATNFGVYTEKNSYEKWAEAYAQLRNAPESEWHPFTRSVAAFLKEYPPDYHAKYGISDLVNAENMTPAERQAAAKEIVAIYERLGLRASARTRAWAVGRGETEEDLFKWLEEQGER